jgi:hypothetical protein
VPRAAEGERPVDLVVEHVQRPVAAVAAAVLGDDHVAQLGELVGREHRPRRVERRVHGEQPRARVAHERRDGVGRGEEAALGPARERHPLGPDLVHVVVVVPRGHRVHHPVARVDERAVRAVDPGARAAGDEHLRGVVLEAEPARPERRDGRAQGVDAARRRVVGLAGAQRVDRPLLEPGRYTELRGVEVADREIAHHGARGPLGADVGGDLEDLGAHEPAGHPRHRRAARVAGGLRRVGRGGAAGAAALGGGRDGGRREGAERVGHRDAGGVDRRRGNDRPARTRRGRPGFYKLPASPPAPRLSPAPAMPATAAPDAFALATTDLGVRESFAQDASGLALLPEAVARPTTADEVVAVLREAHAGRTPVTPAGALTGYAGGALSTAG